MDLGSAWVGAVPGVVPGRAVVPGTAVGVATVKIRGSGLGVGVNAACAVAVARRGGLARPQAVRKKRVRSEK